MNLPSLSLVSLAEMCRSLLQTGIGLLLQFSLVLLLGLAAGALLRRRGPALQCLIYKAALAGALLCCLFSLSAGRRFTPDWGLKLPPGDRVLFVRADNGSEPSDMVLPPPHAAVRMPSASAPSARLEVPGKALSVTVLPNHAASQAATDAPSQPDFFPFASSVRKPPEMNALGRLYLAVVGVWLGGAVLLLGWLLICYRGIARLRRRCRPIAAGEAHTLLHAICAIQHVTPQALLACEEVKNVFLTGLWHPAILLPADYAQAFDPPMLRSILAHEVAHLIRKDTAWTLYTRLLCAVGWIQPFVWLLCRQWEQAGEEVCDLYVVQMQTSPRAYADCLLRLAERLAPSRYEQVTGTGIVAFRSSLGRRVQHLLAHSSQAAKTLSSGVRIAAISGMVGAVALVAMLVPVAALSDRDTWGGNVRLDQRVKISAEGISLGELFPLLTSKTGVNLTTSRAIADEKVVLFGPARPLKAILSDLAALLDATWVRDRDRDGRDRFELARDVKAQQYEEELSRANDKQFLEQIDAQVKALDETPEELAQRPANDPIRQAMSVPKMRAATGIYALLTSEQKQQLLERWSFSLPVSALSEKQKDAIEDLFHGARFEALNNLPEVRSGRMIPVAEIPRDQMDKQQITLDIMGWSGNEQVYVTAPTGFNMLLTDFHARAKFVLPPHGDPYTGAKIDPAAPLPDPKVVNGIADDAWVERLRALAEQTGQPILSDYYRSKPIRVAEKDDEAIASGSAQGALDAFCRPQGYLWWNRGKTLLFRKRDWYEQRLYEVPDRWVVELTQRLNAHHNQPTCADILRLSDLTTDQIVGLMGSAGGQADRRLLLGLREALAAIAAAPGDKDAPPWSGVISPDTADRVSIKPDIADPRQRELLAAYGELEHVPDNELYSGHFGFVILPNERNPPAGATKLNIGLVTHYAVAKSLHAGYLLTVPLALPDDRRANTRIEVGADH